MNPKNQYITSSQSTCITSQYSSPSTSRMAPTLSFANICTRPKHQKQNYQCSKSPNLHGKSSKNIQIRREKAMSPKSSQKHINHVMEAFELENKSLKSTVAILKEQIEALNSSYKMLKEKYKKLKRDAEENETRLDKKMKEFIQYESKARQYDQLVPKIEQLEVLQDKVLDENVELKKKQSKMRAAMTSVLVLIGNSQNQTLASIRNTLRQACNDC